MERVLIASLARTARSLAAVVVVALLLTPATPALAAADGATVLRWLSAQREHSGIPAALAEQADWSAGCAAHMSYIAQNGGVLRHDEVQGQPGYSDAGNWAGTHAVLSTGSWTAADRDPFEHAPIHLAQMLAPALTTSGVANAQGLCITTWPGYLRPAPAATSIVTYPGPGTTIYPTQTVREGPFTPHAKLGIPESGNGPTIYAFGIAPGAVYGGQPKLVSAALTGPAGAVPLVTADWTNADFGAYLAPGTALLIPTTPLTSGASYNASVTMRAAADAQDVTHSWSFSAGTVTQAVLGAPPAPLTPPVVPPAPGPGNVPPATGSPPGAGGPALTATGSIRRLDARTVRVRLTLPAASIGHRLRIVAVARGGRQHSVSSRRVRTAVVTMTLSLPRKTAQLRISVLAGAGHVLRLRFVVPRTAGR